MIKRRLGRSDIEVSPIGLGCWQFSAGGRGPIASYWGEIAGDTVNAIVDASLAGGIDWFDTAEAYGFGASERALAHALTRAGKRDGDVVVATKWMPFLRTAANLQSTIAKRQSALAPFHIDLYQVHQPWAFASIEAQMDAMADLVAAHDIRAIGVSNFNERQMRAASAALQKRGLSLASNQMPYSLLDRRIETNGVLRAAQELGVSIIAYSPLAQGLLTGKFHDDPKLVEKRSLARRVQLRRKLAETRPLVDALKGISASLGATPAQVSLAWLTAFHGDTVVAIPGATSTSHVTDNVRAMSLELPARDLARIDELSRPFASSTMGGRQRRRATA